MIRRRDFLSAGGALLAQAQDAAKPNVVLFLADDVGWNDVGFQGGEIRTPNINSIARAGVRFSRMYACPFCSPTRAALLTGRSPVRYGLVYSVVRPWSTYGLPADEHILPETLSAAGYQTAMFGKWHLGHAHRRQLPHARGFDRFYGFVNADIDYYKHTHAGGLDWQRNGKGVVESGYATDLLADEAVRYLQNRDRSRPFFMYLPFGAAHSPFQAPEKYIARYENIRDPNRRVYAAMISCMDDAVGRILLEIERQGLAGNTLVLFLSDNGGPGRVASNHPLRAAKGTVFEGGIRVPAAARWPKVLPAGGQVDQLMTVMDLFPTIAGALALKSGATKPLDGENMWPEIVNGRERPRTPLFFAVKRNETDERQYAIRKGDWKLVQEFAYDRNRFTYLFNLREDPNEQFDLAAEKPDLVKELAAEIQRWKAFHPAVEVNSSMTPHPGWIPPRDFAAAAAGYEAQ